ncbi:hypothetical protein M3J09_009905 [Ascochyta lentis]
MLKGFGEKESSNINNNDKNKTGKLLLLHHLPESIRHKMSTSPRSK